VSETIIRFDYETNSGFGPLFSFGVGADGDWETRFQPEIEEWCSENLTRPYHIIYEDYVTAWVMMETWSLAISFSSPTDAVLFTLRWADTV
jgi:hypothetical protein